jgi:hypothetical protein
LALKNSRKCDVRELIGKMAILPELVIDMQTSSARGAAQMALAMCLAQAPTLNLEEASTSIPEDADPNELLDVCSGYDIRIVMHICHDEFYEKHVLLADEAIEAELLKKADAEKKPVGSDEGSQFTWTSSKETNQDRLREMMKLRLLRHLTWRNNLSLCKTKDIASFGPFVGM